MRKKFLLTILCAIMLVISGCNGTIENSDFNKAENCGYMVIGNTYVLYAQNENGDQYDLVLSEDGIEGELYDVISEKERQELQEFYIELRNAEDKNEVIEVHMERYVQLLNKYNRELE